ncbi:hypothetical protein [Pseudomonas fluorescens]|uniref:Uncharacterized protein n=1 Tax=Pseudomonas fluorescens TaxID=294 RepID=A0A5E6X431_PSEFL|nr:hypothetical protein [Pseudomonas fluorescens]VVN35913.1 hypothetical protein PS652_05116 [Pseudomonas fluorescens]
MSIKTATLEWRYQPIDLFKETHTIESHGATLVIQDGVARAETDTTLHQSDPTLTDKLRRVIFARLAPYGLHRKDPVVVEDHPILTVTHADGRSREIYLESFASIRITDSIQIQVYRDGVLIQDSAQELSDRQQVESELLSKHAGDDLLSRLLASQSESKRDSGDEFTHLYEILEALQARFGKLPKLTEALGIEKSKIGKFHAVCNAPSTVSRHRGLTKGPLREPTAEEFNHARSYAWEMILAYARWLGKQSS